MGRETHHTYWLHHLCHFSNTIDFRDYRHFVAAILPRFTIFLMIEIRAKVKTGEPKVRQCGRTFFLELQL